jgi:hypothetical protein
VNWGQAQFSNGTESATWLALTTAPNGDRNKTLEYLEKAFASQEIELVVCIHYPTPGSDTLYLRYADLMRRTGLPE